MNLPVIKPRDLNAYQRVKTSTEHVYKSTYEPTGTCVFIKLLSWIGRSERDRLEILKDVEYIGRIKAEFLTETIGIFKTSNTIGIVTEWMANESLNSLIYQHDLYPVLPLNICIRILTDVAKGLTFLHNLNPPVKHQHLKPCNILLDAQYRAKLSDFWLSELQKVPFTSVQDDNTSLVYLSPQRLQKYRSTTADDIYSFGILLHETLSRKRPFHENNPMKLETEIIRGVRPQPNMDVILKDTGLSQAQRRLLSRLINLCWHSEPSMRPTAAECLSCLQTIQQTFSNEIECGIHTLHKNKERASQHSQIRQVEFDIRYLYESWTSDSIRSRTQSAPDETTGANSLCPEAVKDKRSVSLPGPSPLNMPSTCHDRGTSNNHGVRWTRGEPGDHATCPSLTSRINPVETLRRNREIILKSMTQGHLNHLIDIMRSKCVLTRDDSENICAEKTLTCKTRKWLDTCSEKGEEASRVALENLSSRNVICMHPRHPA
ncbi:receptor-interacting serine/threonine-protein kinase 2-like [Mixophyes fleayi]|uniref:receptor-interacting serine/threonine-protein kinase 2-like n=1 Tax=Mixophyes fleayi TaxID=3061075 RepID=UPI003F4E4489